MRTTKILSIHLILLLFFGAGSVFLVSSDAMSGDKPPKKPPMSSAAPGIRILDHGIYQMDITRRVAAPNDISLERNIVSNIRLIRKARTIAAQLGRSFGYRFKVHASLTGQRLTMRTTFPPLTNPKTKRLGRTQTRSFNVRNGTTYYDGYRFDYGWEMAEGIWTFELLDGNKVLARQTFKIVIPLN
jgi:Domain of unknown function (DUF3859)